jgi:hypothetical protein
MIITPEVTVERHQADVWMPDSRGAYIEQIVLPECLGGLCQPNPDPATCQGPLRKL